MDDREPPAGVRGFATLRWAHEAALDGRIVAGSLVVVLVLTVAFALAGRVEQGGLSHRVLLWITCAVVCWPVCHALAAAILYLSRSRPPALIAWAAACGTFFLTLFCTAVAYTAYGLFYPAREGPVPILAIYVNVTLLTVVASAVMHFAVCQIGALRHGLRKAGAHPDGSAAGPVVSRAAAPAGDRAAWFFERLPSGLGRDIVCLRVSGHYLEVATADGSCLVLLPLSDAVKALRGLGMQVHRSHWVAHRHVLGIVRRGDRTLLQLTGGREVPVSRSRVAEVRQAVRRHGTSPGGLAPSQ